MSSTDAGSGGTSSPSHDDESPQPTRLFHEVRRESHYWLHEAACAQSGVGTYSVEFARRRLHRSLENYWRLARTPVEEQLPPRMSLDDLRSADPETLDVVAWLWTQAGIFEVGDEWVSGLYSLAEWWSMTEPVVETESTLYGGTVEHVEYVPAHLTVDQSRFVLYRLDELASELAIGYKPPKRRKRATLGYWADDPNAPHDSDLPGLFIDKPNVPAEPDDQPSDD